MVVSPRSSLVSIALLAVLAALPGTARGQAVDCAGLRARLDEARRDGDPGRVEAAIRGRRDEIARARSSAADGGCEGGGIFDDPGSDQCRALARRIGQLEAGLQRLQDEAARGDPAADDRRRALALQVEAACPMESDGDPDGTVSIDPDAPPSEGTPAPRASFARVLCVRRCDGAYYPLAVDIAADRMRDMDRVCQAQCPAAESSAFGGPEDEDVSGALASDGTPYSALASAFKFRSGTSPDCACRAAHQSWTEALAGAEALLETHKGDVTVTPALADAMARPVPVPPVAASGVRASAPLKAASAPRRSAAARKHAGRSDPLGTVAAPNVDQGQDLTREFRRSDPTL